PRAKMLVFIHAAVLAGLSGWLYAHLQRAVNPTPFGAQAGIEYLFIAVVGGAGYVWGGVLGAAIVVVLEEVLESYLPLILPGSGRTAPVSVRPSTASPARWRRPPARSPCSAKRSTGRHRRRSSSSASPAPSST